MSKTIKRAMRSKAADMREQMYAIDSAMLRYQSMVMLRNRIIEGSLTDDLYKFLNSNGALESILVDLPLKSRVPTASVEDLQTAQLAYVDNAIEGIISGIKDMILKMLKMFGEWVADWAVTNRRLKFALRRNITRLNNYITDYGDPFTFDKARGVCFTHDEWKSMLKASQDINALMKNVPSTDPAKYLVAHYREYAKGLTEFGYVMTEHSIEKDDPKYLKRNMAIGRSGAKWIRDNLANDCSAAMNNLTEELESSKIVNNISLALRKAATEATDPNDLEAMKWLVGICKAAEICAGVCARAVLDICNIAKRNA